MIDSPKPGKVVSIYIPEESKVRFTLHYTLYIAKEYSFYHIFELTIQVTILS